MVHLTFKDSLTDRDSNDWQQEGLQVTSCKFLKLVPTRRLIKKCFQNSFVLFPLFLAFILLHKKFLRFDWFRAVLFQLKVIPLFCTAHPLLRITMLHPRWRRFFPLARKERTRAAFAELKLLFAIIMPQIG